MNEEKKKRLMELIEKGNCTDKEIAEINKLEEEIRSGNNQDEPKPNQEEIKQLIEKPKRERKSIIQYLIQRYKKKPATWDEIQQLKLERTKAFLERDIKLAKSQTPSRFAKATQLLSALSNNQTNTKKKKKSKSRLYEPDESYNIGNTDPKRFKKLLGNNDPKRFDNL